MCLRCVTPTRAPTRRAHRLIKNKSPFAILPIWGARKQNHSCFRRAEVSSSGVPEGGRRLRQDPVLLPFRETVQTLTPARKTNTDTHTTNLTSPRKTAGRGDPSPSPKTPEGGCVGAPSRDSPPRCYWNEYRHPADLQHFYCCQTLLKIFITLVSPSLASYPILSVLLCLLH